MNAGHTGLNATTHQRINMKIASKEGQGEIRIRAYQAIFID